MEKESEPVPRASCLTAVSYSSSVTSSTAALAELMPRGLEIRLTHTPRSVALDRRPAASTAHRIKLTALIDFFRSTLGGGRAGAVSTHCSSVAAQRACTVVCPEDAELRQTAAVSTERSDGRGSTFKPYGFGRRLWRRRRRRRERRSKAAGAHRGGAVGSEAGRGVPPRHRLRQHCFSAHARAGGLCWCDDRHVGVRRSRKRAFGRVTAGRPRMSTTAQQQQASPTWEPRRRRMSAPRARSIRSAEQCRR